MLRSILRNPGQNVEYDIRGRRVPGGQPADFAYAF
jgi:hypothetical protein